MLSWERVKRRAARRAASVPRECGSERERLFLAVADLGAHAALFATEFPPTLARFLRAHTLLQLNVSEGRTLAAPEDETRGRRRTAISKDLRPGARRRRRIVRLLILTARAQDRQERSLAVGVSQRFYAAIPCCQGGSSPIGQHDSQQLPATSRMVSRRAPQIIAAAALGRRGKISPGAAPVRWCGSSW